MTSQLTVQVRVAWWVRWYLAGVAMVVARLTGLQPDAAKVLATAMRGIRVEGK